MRQKMEIERKFLMKKKPQGLPILEQAVVYQGYLCTKPTVRIRKKQVANNAPTFRLCIKGKGTLCRTEVETDLTEQQFTELCGLLSREMVRKDYTVYALPDEKKLEYSIVDCGKPTSFCYAEVEFSSKEDATTFIPPEFLGREVTEVPGFTMSDYWEKTSKPSDKD